MNVWKTAILALLVAAVGFYITKIEIPRQAEEKIADQLFKGVNSSALSAIEIASPQGEVKLSQSVKAKGEAASGVDEVVDLNAAAWSLSDVPGSVLDQGVLTSLVTALLSIKKEFTVPNAERETDLGVYGLAKPELTVKAVSTLNSIEISFGKENAFLKKRYAKLAGDDAVFLTDGALFTAASKKRDDFRDKTPIDFYDSQLKKVQIQAERIDVTLEAAGDFEWKITSPVNFSASSNAVTDLLRQLKNLQATEFVDHTNEPRKNFGLEKPTVTLDLTFRENSKREPLKIAIGKSAAADAFYLSVGTVPTIYKLSTDPLPAVRKGVDDLREKQLFKLDYDQVVSAEFQPATGDKITLTKDGEEWNINGKAADSPFVKGIIDNLSALTASGFPVDTRDYGFATPQAVWTLILKDDQAQPPTQKTRKLTIGSAVDAEAKTFYAAADALTEAFEIDLDSLKKITPRVETLLKIEASATPTGTPGAVAVEEVSK